MFAVELVSSGLWNDTISSRIPSPARVTVPDTTSSSLNSMTVVLSEPGARVSSELWLTRLPPFGLTACADTVTRPAGASSMRNAPDIWAMPCAE